MQRINSIPTIHRRDSILNILSIASIVNILSMLSTHSILHMRSTHNIHNTRGILVWLIIIHLHLIKQPIRHLKVTITPLVDLQLNPLITYLLFGHNQITDLPLEKWVGPMANDQDELISVAC
ncbi:hypothetical protein N5P37_003559 [Trichoderma harzianum]|nr:hypothetical protein N5P37_003559 [Trichoderma harzianum]